MPPSQSRRCHALGTSFDRLGLPGPQDLYTDSIDAAEYTGFLNDIFHILAMVRPPSSTSYGTRNPGACLAGSSQSHALIPV